MNSAPTIHPLIQKAYAVLDGQPLDKNDALAIANDIHGADLLDLVSLANKVRLKFAPALHSCSIINAKSGKCRENCRFCAQSAFHGTGIDTYPVLAPEEVLKAAREAYDEGVRTFGYVTSGRGWSKPDADFRTILDTLDLLHRELPDMYLCVSLGILSEECVKLLAEHHVQRYNMNLQTSPARYGELIATTHTIEEKLDTIRLLKRYGIANCTGGIFGLGETWEDRVDMAYAIRELDVEASPLNILLPIPGTPLEHQSLTTPADAAKTFAIFRLVNPTKMLKFCAGRETVMKDYQGLLMLAGMNGLMTGGYLTTRGRDVGQDRAFAASLEGFGGKD
ncbi:MAG: biotin synthase BioB [Lentisphaeria bacterium]|nr:biotin synthase BioB [Lentisphaeria bacterium]